MNVQVYFHKKCEDIQRIPQEKKREIFNAGMSRVFSSVQDLKTLILEQKYFGIVEIDGDKAKLSDGTISDANFELCVDSSYRPANGNPVFCLFSTVNRVFFEGRSVNVNAIEVMTSIPKNMGSAEAVGDDVKKHVKQLVDLFGRGADKIGDIVTDDDIKAVEFLERVVR